MARSHRKDEPGAWHHVMNRGIARRPVFEDRACVRRFLAALARSTRRGELELHAFAILTTHFHLLVRSPCGELSRAMGRVQNEYVRWFNRRRRRDGPLFRGRFRSHWVDTRDYRVAVRRYIDWNPVEAGLVRSPQDYPFCSAGLAHMGKWPRWLAPAAMAGQRELEPASSAPERFALWPARGSEQPADPQELDLVGTTPGAVRAKLHYNARLADGVRCGSTRVDRERALEACSTLGQDLDSVALRTAILRQTCGLNWREVSEHLGLSDSAACRRLERHQRRIASDPVYRSRWYSVLRRL